MEAAWRELGGGKMARKHETISPCLFFPRCGTGETGVTSDPESYKSFSSPDGEIQQEG